MIRSKGLGRLLSAGVTALILAACSVAEPPVAPTQLSSFDGRAANGFDGAVFACKAGGPAGTYSFHVEKSGGGNSWFPYGQDATVNFDGTNMVCAHMWSPLDVATWGPGVTGTVTVTETALPTGVVVDYIQVWDSRNQVFLSPVVTGSNSVTITVNATNNLYYAKYYNKLTPPTPSANCVAISAVQGVAITPVTVSGSGGAGGPYTFSATGLPDGLTMSSSGTISGTPTVSGTFSYTVTVTDKDGTVGSGGTCSVTVSQPPSASCVAVTAMQGVAITPVTLVGSGGAGGPYTFAATGLPAGLTLSTSGVLSGTPTVSGSFSYTVTVTDKDGNVGSGGICSVTVSERPRVSASCVAINAVQGVSITPVTLVGSGGAGGPYTFSATGLPAGLTLSTDGVLSGTPTVSGSFSYTVTVTDKDGNTGSGGTCSVTVTPPPPKFAGETAVGAGYRYPNTSNWFMYSPYKTTKIDLIAGQHYDAGDIYMSRTSTSTIIRIVLQNGFQWDNVAENLKIQPFNSAPTDYVQPGSFAYKYTVSGNTVTVTISGTSAKFYGIHGDVLRPLP